MGKGKGKVQSRQSISMPWLWIPVPLLFLVLGPRFSTQVLWTQGWLFAGQIACDEDSQASISQSMPLSLTVSVPPAPPCLSVALSLFLSRIPSRRFRRLCVSCPMSFWLSVNMPFAFAISEVYCWRGASWAGPVSWRDNHFGKLLMNDLLA